MVCNGHDRRAGLPVNMTGKTNSTSSVQDELKLWDSHTQDGFVAGSTFTLAGTSTQPVDSLSCPGIPHMMMSVKC